MPKYFLLAWDTNKLSFFFLQKIKMSKQKSPLTKKYCREWSSIINSWISSSNCQKSCCHQGEGLISTYSFQEKIFRGIGCYQVDHRSRESSSWHSPTKLLNQFFISSHHVLKFMCWTLKKATQIDSFLGNFLILIGERLCRTRVTVVLNVLFIYFQGTIKFSHNIWLIWLFWVFIWI